MSDKKTEGTGAAEPNLPFEDEKAMFGTSPINKELDDDEVEYLTARTAPRVVLTRSRRKTFLYCSLSLMVILMMRMVYFRTAPVTGMEVPPVFGLGETGFAVLLAGMSIGNLFLVPPEESNVKWLSRSIGTGLPLLVLALLYLLPPEFLLRHLHFLF